MKKIILLALLSVAALAVSLDNFVDKSKCDQVIDKQLYEICYSHK